MGGINTYYTPGAVHTDVSGGSPGGAMGIDPFFSAMARRRAAQEDEDRARAAQEHELKMQAMRQAMVPPVQQERPSITPNEQLLKGAQMQAQMAQADLATKQATARPADFGRMQMNNIGDWGNVVDPNNVPGALHDTIKGGFYSFGNNPMISQMYPGIVRQGINGGKPLGADDDSIEAQQMAAQRASTQNTNLVGRLPTIRGGG